MDQKRLAEITPQLARNGVGVPDADLPMLAAMWLAQGYDSEPLRQLAGLTHRDGPEARGLVSAVLESLGLPIRESRNPYDELPWRGYWSKIEWVQLAVDDLLSPYAAAQRVLEVVGDAPDLWNAGRGDELMRELERWDQQPNERPEVDEELRAIIRSLGEGDVPPLVG